jgi:hypothetical protein
MKSSAMVGALVHHVYKKASSWLQLQLIPITSAKHQATKILKNQPTMSSTRVWRVLQTMESGGFIPFDGKLNDKSRI